MNVLISACLLGQYCRYDGQVKVYPQVQDLLGRDDIHLIPVCPEQAGGLATPRPPAERQGERVVTADGTDVTAQYRRGAEAALYLARLFHCTKAILKEKSVLWTRTDLRWHFFTDPDGWRRRDGGVITRRRP